MAVTLASEVFGREVNSHTFVGLLMISIGILLFLLIRRSRA
jgi:uncharacterized membrane protein